MGVFKIAQKKLLYFCMLLCVRTPTECVRIVKDLTEMKKETFRSNLYKYKSESYTVYIRVLTL